MVIPLTNSHAGVTGIICYTCSFVGTKGVHSGPHDCAARTLTC